MESILIWGSTILVCSLIVAFYARKVKHGQKRDMADRSEARELGVDKPRAQHPMVDLNRCIGCGSCVAACPEGGVLGMINGKASIINGLRCVGHGRCAEACPVEAVSIGMGDVSQRDDLPLLDVNYQTNLPGLFIVGELSGLALIRNAIMQGTLAARAIAQRTKPSSTTSEVWDLVIVGAGPAGMSAAVEAKSLGLRPLLLDQREQGGTILRYPRKKLVLTQPVEVPGYGWLRKPEYAKEALLEIWAETLTKCNIQVTSGIHVEDVVRTDGQYEIRSPQGSYYASNVVLALGRGGTPRKLEVPGEDDAKVFYQLTDAAQFQTDSVLVVGGGDSAIEAAIALGRQPGNTVTLSYRKHKFFRIKRRNAQHLEEAVKRKQIHVIVQSEVRSIGSDHVLLSTPDGDLTLANQYVFVFTGGIPPFDLLRRAGIQFGSTEVAL